MEYIPYCRFKRLNSIPRCKNGEVAGHLNRLGYTNTSTSYWDSSRFKRLAKKMCEERFLVLRNRDAVYYGRLNTTGNREGLYELLIFTKNL